MSPRVGSPLPPSPPPALAVVPRSPPSPCVSACPPSAWHVVAALPGGGEGCVCPLSGRAAGESAGARLLPAPRHRPGLVAALPHLLRGRCPQTRSPAAFERAVARPVATAHPSLSPLSFLVWLGFGSRPPGWAGSTKQACVVPAVPSVPGLCPSQPAGTGCVHQEVQWPRHAGSCVRGVGGSEPLLVD